MLAACMVADFPVPAPPRSKTEVVVSTTACWTSSNRISAAASPSAVARPGSCGERCEDPAAIALTPHSDLSSCQPLASDGPLPRSPARQPPLRQLDWPGLLAASPSTSPPRARSDHCDPRTPVPPVASVSPAGMTTCLAQKPGLPRSPAGLPPSCPSVALVEHDSPTRLGFHSPGVQRSGNDHRRSGVPAPRRFSRICGFQIGR